MRRAIHVLHADGTRSDRVQSTTLEAAPEKAATSLQGLTKTSPGSAKTRGERMATTKDRRIS
jgi:hypothetical protein